MQRPSASLGEKFYCDFCGSIGFGAITFLERLHLGAVSLSLPANWRYHEGIACEACSLRQESGERLYTAERARGAKETQTEVADWLRKQVPSDQVPFGATIEIWADLIFTGDFKE